MKSFFSTSLICKSLPCAVYGVGTVDTIMGAYFINLSFSIDLTDQDQKVIAVLQQNELIIEWYDRLNVHVDAFLPSQMRNKYDIIFLARKTLTTKKSFFLSDFFKEDSAIVFFQDGISKDVISSIVGPQRTLICECVMDPKFLSIGILKLMTQKKQWFLFR
jgi:2-dehydropantoate 2-reductase